MKVTVCQLDANCIEEEWTALVHHTRQQQSDIVILPEMPFSNWLTSLKEPIPAMWHKACEQHIAWEERLHELNSDIVVGTKPIIDADTGEYHNVGYVWTKEDGIIEVHRKYYLPDEEGFWEATWYEPGDKEFSLVDVKGIKFGFLICTEMWFLRHAQEYGEQGMHFLLSPRSTPIETVEKWISCGRVSSVVGGAFSISSNHCGNAPDGQTVLGGVGWIADPEGNILDRTSHERPFVTLMLDVEEADKAKLTYPRYVKR